MFQNWSSFNNAAAILIFAAIEKKQQKSQLASPDRGPHVQWGELGNNPRAWQGDWLDYQMAWPYHNLDKNGWWFEIAPTLNS